MILCRNSYYPTWESSSIVTVVKKIMETETNSNAAGAHHAQGDRTNWSNVRQSTRLLATKALAGIKNNVCAELKMKRHHAYLHRKNKK